MSTKSRKLVEQQHALDDFFESLMRDVQEYAEQQEVVAADPAQSSPVLQAKPAAVKLQEIQLEVAPPPLRIPLPTVAPPVTEIIIPAVVATPAIPAKTETVTPVIEEPPAWSRHPFQALLFKVAGLTLAVPLVDLNGVVEWRADAVTAMPGHADFYLGLLPHLGKNVALIDTARLVLPADRLPDLAGDDPYARISRIVLIQDGYYGLACDAVADVITLQPQDVRWRTSRTQRRWLAGTVVAQMCALIDASAFAQMLADRLSPQAFRE